MQKGRCSLESSITFFPSFTCQLFEINPFDENRGGASEHKDLNLTSVHMSCYQNLSDVFVEF